MQAELRDTHINDNLIDIELMSLLTMEAVWQVTCYKGTTVAETYVRWEKGGNGDGNEGIGLQDRR
eukprot:3834945-Prorocentrum_lima.AAC.1